MVVVVVVVVMMMVMMRILTSTSLLCFLLFLYIYIPPLNHSTISLQFVEFKPDKNSKHINSIRIQSIAASLRQHGLGVLNTTVNYTYQFLRKKFHIFSQFLFDDYIKAHLSREHRWFRKHKHDEDVNTCYPYERAKRFVVDIRRLPGGMNKEGKSYLDMFRLLITEIGNALGYVRMVRSAGMFYCSQAVTYLPDFENVISFADWADKGPQKDAAENTEGGPENVEGAAFSEETIRAGKNLDNVIGNLINNFGEGSDYFKVIVKTFQALLVQVSRPLFFPFTLLSAAAAAADADDADNDDEYTDLYLLCFLLFLFIYSSPFSFCTGTRQREEGEESCSYDYSCY